MFKNWTNEKLEEFVLKLEEMSMQGVRQSTFKDQTLIFGSTQEIEQRLKKAYKALEDRGLTTSSGSNPISKNKKVVRIQTKDDGFK